MGWKRFVSRISQFRGRFCESTVFDRAVFLEKRPFFVGLFLKKRPGKLGSLQPRRIIVLAGNVGHDSFICAT